MSRANSEPPTFPRDADIEDETARDLDLELIAEEQSETRIHTPPPHIAARFYRPSANRRKSSAASSRRNSVSSAHSQVSHTSGRRNVSQSSYIAHNLRRASIIEDRKARLADRAAHAEKVRLRAALAKTPTRSSTTEERALAAQQARERNLAEIVAACAEEVKRAKGIAESMKEKREAEVKKLRKDMDDRLAEAERRREEIRSKSYPIKGRRSISQPRKAASPVLEKVPEHLSDESAATRIQRAWRVHVRKKVLGEFRALNLNSEAISATPFEAVVELLAQDEVILSTASILRACGLKEGEPGSVNEMAAVRTFLSAFLILGHPTQVLSGRGEVNEQEQVGVVPVKRDDLANPRSQDLVVKAKDLLICFQTTLSRLSVSSKISLSPTQIALFAEAYAAYHKAFIAWKARDSSALIEMMVMQFVELDSIWQTVKDSTEEAVTEVYREGIRKNQLELLVRIKRLAGQVQGKKLIANAVRESRKAKQAKKPPGETSRPRAAVEDSGAAEAAVAEFARTSQAVSEHLQQPTPPSTPCKKANADVDFLRNATTILPNNRIVAHEMALNREYRITDDALEGKSLLMESVLDSMRQAIATGNSADWILAMAGNIRGKLQALLKNSPTLCAEVGEVLDEQIIAQALVQGNFSYENFFSYMVELLPKLCAPVRDDDINVIGQLIKSSSDVVDRLQATMHAIDLLQLDFANFMLQQVAPDLVRHAVPYETQRFSKIMEETSNDLSATSAAFKLAFTQVHEEAARRDPENVNLTRSRPTLDKAHAQMLVNIITALDGSQAVPETLLLDVKRIVRIRAELLRIITAGAILLNCKNLFKRDGRSQWKVEASRIMTVLEGSKGAEQAIEGIKVALLSARALPESTKAAVHDLVTRIVNAAGKVNIVEAAEQETSPRAEALNDPVMRLLMTRLRGHLLTRISASTDNERVRSASTSSDTLATLGLAEFVQKIGSIVEEIGKVGSLDRAAHGLWYEKLASEFEQSA